MMPSLTTSLSAVSVRAVLVNSVVLNEARVVITPESCVTLSKATASLLAPAVSSSQDGACRVYADS